MLEHGVQLGQFGRFIDIRVAQANSTLAKPLALISLRSFTAGTFT